MARHLKPNLVPPMPEIPAVHKSAVGLAAIELVNLGDWHDEKATRLRQTGDESGYTEAASTAARIYEKVPIAFDSIRNAISEVPREPSYQTYFRDIVARTSSVYNGRRSDVLEWLANKKHGASDSELLRVFNQQIATLAEQQYSSEVAQAVETERSRYIAAVHEGVTQDWLSAHSLASLDVISRAKVYVGDLWGTRLKGWLAYRPHGKDEMVVAQSISPNKVDWGREVAQEIEKSGWHEFRHIQTNDAWLPRWIKEPAAEYSSLSLRFGYSGKLVDFETRPIEEVHYIGEMALWDTLLQKGSEFLEGRLLLKAHSSEGPQSREWAELDKALDSSWGFSGVRFQVDEFIQRTEATIGAAEPDWSESQIQREAIRLVEDTLARNPEALFGSVRQRV